MNAFRRHWLLAQALLWGAGLAWAAESSEDLSQADKVQPYLESLRKKHDLRPRPLEPELPPPAPVEQPTKNDVFSENPQEVQPHIEAIRERHALPSAQPVHRDFSNSPNQVQPHLEAIKGNRELEPKVIKKVNQSAGFAVVASNRFNIKSDQVQANAFESVYTPNEKYSPSVDLFYEYQLYRNHYVGAIGLVGHLNFITTKGRGVFTRTGTPSQDTEFRYYAVPVSLGGSYKFVQLRYVAPYIQFSGVGIPMLELRNDDKPSRRGISRGFSVTGGVAFNLDWMGREEAWAQYDSHGILHTYLIVQLDYVRTISGPVKFNYDGTYVGLMFEF